MIKPVDLTEFYCIFYVDILSVHDRIKQPGNIHSQTEVKMKKYPYHIRNSFNNCLCFYHIRLCWLCQYYICMIYHSGRILVRSMYISSNKQP